MKRKRFEVFSSLMIAFVTICGAVTAWRASVAGIKAGDEDFDGLSAAISRQEKRILNSVTSYEHYRAFTTFYRYNDLGDQVNRSSLPDGRIESSELWGMALGLRYAFFPPKYLDQVGIFNLQRELDELWAEANALDDLNPQPHYVQADQLRDKSTILTGCLIVFATAFFFFALGQAIPGSLKYGAALLGILTTVVGIGLVLVFEFSI